MENLNPWARIRNGGESCYPTSDGHFLSRSLRRSLQRDRLRGAITIMVMVMATVAVLTAAGLAAAMNMRASAISAATADGTIIGEAEEFASTRATATMVGPIATIETI